MIRPRRPRAAIALAALLTMLCTVALVPGAASAAARFRGGEGSDRHGVLPDAAPGVFRLAAAPDGTQASPADAVDCFTHLDPLIQATSSIQATGSVWCTSPVPSLTLQVTLFWNHFPGAYDRRTSTQNVGVHAFGPCLNGE
ncbi:hypothetical protein ACFORO_28155 [Amycolatopsis halotolerans]|uniref:Uncharacterized protein n=1 Tax=Amycolatopsis halotolerans TaxID=330083 RepID=A0ABV7QP17_9PSEU